MWCQLIHKISLGSHVGVNFVTKYIVIVLVVYLEGISNITAVGTPQHVFFVMGPATVKGLFYISNSYLVDPASSHMLVLNAFIWTSLTKVLCHTCIHEYPLREGDSTFFRFYKKSATIYN